MNRWDKEKTNLNCKIVMIRK